MNLHKVVGALLAASDIRLTFCPADRALVALLVVGLQTRQDEIESFDRTYGNEVGEVIERAIEVAR